MTREAKIVSSLFIPCKCICPRIFLNRHKCYFPTICFYFKLLALAKPTPAPTKTAKTAAQKSPTPPRSLGNTSQDKTETTILSPGKKAAPKSSTVAPKEGNKSQNKTTTIKPSPCRKAESTKAAPNKSMEQTGVNAKAIQAVTADITKTKNDYLPFENQEETAMRLLRIHQMEEAMRNTHGEYYTER